MKKLLLISAVCLLSLSLPADSDLPALSSENLKALDIQQTSDWEYLGTTEYYRLTNQRAGNGAIYVKIIGNKAFYQIRIKMWDGSIGSFKVTEGDYTVRGKKYNAKFSAHIFPEGPQEYYLNM